MVVILSLSLTHTHAHTHNTHPHAHTSAEMQEIYFWHFLESAFMYHVRAVILTGRYSKNQLEKHIETRTHTRSFGLVLPLFVWLYTHAYSLLCLFGLVTLKHLGL